MHLRLIHAAILALAGLCVLLAVSVREARHSPEALRDPAWWFLLAIFAGLLVGVIPYVLVYALGIP